MAPDRLDLSLLLLQQNPAARSKTTEGMSHLGQLKSPHSWSLNFLGVKRQQQLIATTRRKALSERLHIQQFNSCSIQPKMWASGSTTASGSPSKGKDREGKCTSEAGASNRHIEAPNTPSWKGFQLDAASFPLCLNAPLTEILECPSAVAQSCQD